MSGAKGMLPTVFDVEPPSKGNRMHQAEKPVKLLEQIMEFITEEKEWVLDQFAGSFSLGEAALETGGMQSVLRSAKNILRQERNGCRRFRRGTGTGKQEGLKRCRK